MAGQSKNIIDVVSGSSGILTLVGGDPNDGYSNTNHGLILSGALHLTTQNADPDKHYENILYVDSSGDLMFSPAGGTSSTDLTAASITLGTPAGAQGKVLVSSAANLVAVTGSISDIGGAVSTAGGLTVGGGLGVTGDTTLTGNLTVNGLTTIIDSTKLNIKDRIIELGSGAGSTFGQTSGISFVSGSTGAPIGGDLVIGTMGGAQASQNTIIVGTKTILNNTTTVADAIPAGMRVGNLQLDNHATSKVLIISGTTNADGDTLNIGVGDNAASATLIVDSANSAINQSVMTTASPTFAGATLDSVQVGITAANEIDTASGNLILDAAATIQLGVTSTQLDIDIADIDIATQATVLTVKTNEGEALSIVAATNEELLVVDTTTDKEAVHILVGTPAGGAQDAVGIQVLSSGSARHQGSETFAPERLLFLSGAGGAHANNIIDAYQSFNPVAATDISTWFSGSATYQGQGGRFTQKIHGEGEGVTVFGGDLVLSGAIFGRQLTDVYGGVGEYGLEVYSDILTFSSLDAEYPQTVFQGAHWYHMDNGGGYPGEFSSPDNAYIVISGSTETGGSRWGAEENEIPPSWKIGHSFAASGSYPLQGQNVFNGDLVVSGNLVAAGGVLTLTGSENVYYTVGDGNAAITSVPVASIFLDTSDGKLKVAKSIAGTKSVSDLESSGGGGGAPTDAQYVTLATNGTLSAERVLSGSGLGGIKLTDGGAGSNVTLGLDLSSGNLNSANAPIISDGNGRLREADGLSYSHGALAVDDGGVGGTLTLGLDGSTPDWRKITIYNDSVNAQNTTTDIDSSMNIAAADFATTAGAHWKVTVQQSGGSGHRIIYDLWAVWKSDASDITTTLTELGSSTDFQSKLSISVVLDTDIKVQLTGTNDGTNASLEVTAVVDRFRA